MQTHVQQTHAQHGSCYAHAFYAGDTFFADLPGCDLVALTRHQASTQDLKKSSKNLAKLLGNPNPDSRLATRR